jgi:hypothetical protein
MFGIDAIAQMLEHRAGRPADLPANSKEGHRAMRTTNLLLTATVALTVFAVASCCNKKVEEATADDAAAAPTVEESPAEVPTEINPMWKTKCPEADRPLAGTVTATKNLTVYNAPKDGSDRIGSIGPGTWVNLLGSKQNWYCVDFPCKVGELCPGWVEERYTQRKTTTVDAAVVDATVATADAAVALPDAAVAVADSGSALVDIQVSDSGAVTVTVDSGAGAVPTTTTIPGTKLPPGGRPPPIRKK